MSVESFKPTLWEGAILANFHSISTVEATITKPTSIQGEKVIFNRMGAGTIKDYEGTIAWEDINMTPIELTFDQQKYFAFSLDDCDAAQLKSDIMKEATREHGALIAETYDTYVYGVMSAGAKSSNVIGSKSNKTVITAKSAYNYIVDLSTALSQQKVPKADRYCVVNAAVLGLLSKDRRFTASPNVLANGIVEGQRIAGLQLICSEELPANQIIAYYKGSTGGAKQIDKVEALRLQNSFTDGIRGLCKYGATVLRNEAIAVINYSIGTSADDDPAKVEVTNVVKTQEAAAGA